jgi:hypothetical protein
VPHEGEVKKEQAKGHPNLTIESVPRMPHCLLRKSDILKEQQSVFQHTEGFELLVNIDELQYSVLFIRFENLERNGERTKYWRETSEL